MPIYDVKCESCGNVVEVIVKQNQELPACPKCQGKTKKMLSTPVFRLYDLDFTNRNDR